MIFGNKMTYTAVIRAEASVYGKTFQASHDRNKAWETAYNNYGPGLLAIVTGSHEVYTGNHATTNQGVSNEEL